MLLLLLLLHLLAGLGIVAHFNCIQKRAEILGLSILLGMGLHTLVVYLFAACFIPLTWNAILIGMLIATLLTHIRYKKTLLLWNRLVLAPWDVKLYEIPAAAFAAYICYVSFWRAHHIAVTPYDAIVGMDMVAKYAVQEGTLISSAFTHPNLSGHVQNQMYYAPFTTFLQIIYRLAGYNVGQSWLGIFTGAFSLFFYGKLRTITHPILAGLCLAVLYAIPEMYGYTFMFLTDFSSAMFFGAGIVYFYQYSQEKTGDSLILSSILLGLSVWARSDSAIFVGMGAVILLAANWKSEGAKQTLIKTAIWGGIPFAFFALWNIVFFKFYFPRIPQNQLAETASTGLLEKYSYMVENLVFHDMYYGYVFTLFFIWLIVNTLIFRNKKGWESLVWLAVIFIGFGLIAHLFVAASIDNTVKRGFFKLFPIIILYMATSGIGQWVNEKLRAWES